MALFVLSLFGVNYIAAEIIKTIPNKSIIEFPKVWTMIPYISSYLLVILGFIIIMHTCAEYTYRTNRQNVIDGLSRNQYITTKILLILVVALFATTVTFISAFITGLMSGTPVSFEGFRFIFYFFIQTVAYMSVAFLFALLLKKSVLSIGIFFIYSLIVENILEKYINKIHIGVIEKIGGFLPISSSEHLLLPNEMKTLLNMVNMGDSHSEYTYLAASIVYIVLCFYACYFRYEKQDL
jgi:ABC-type transport system involved in multi-copper enzyme maturation permease subunit